MHSNSLQNPTYHHWALYVTGSERKWDHFPFPPELSEVLKSSAKAPPSDIYRQLDCEYTPHTGMTNPYLTLPLLTKSLIPGRELHIPASTQCCSKSQVSQMENCSYHFVSQFASLANSDLILIRIQHSKLCFYK